MGRIEVAPGCFEHEKEFFIDGMWIPESKLKEYQQSRKTIQQEKRPELRCPLKGGTCRADCALHLPEGCAMLQLAGAGEAPEGPRSCPFEPGASLCTPKCAFNASGACAIAIIAQKRKEIAE